MSTSTVADRFAEQNALGYDARIATLVPGYAELHEMSAAVLAARLGERARVLVVGAGTGTETLAFAKANPGWQVLGVDPSPDMLAIARRRAEAESLHNVEFVEGYASGIGAGERFDAAVSLLVMHFIAGSEAKAAFLGEIAALLAPGAPLLLADLAEHDEDDLDAMAAYTLAHGVSEEALPAISTRLREDFHPVSDAELADLAGQTGFAVPRPYFRGLAFAAHQLLRR
ncbi:class I SAM-dependent methyltransferase [Gordonia sp. VNK21]|uniref:class I SAM-dependent methyltransferase n=1 Tax=Gordonia sp. VNK21 TaxID=3382483 RepID=UPI0038D5190C